MISRILKSVLLLAPIVLAFVSTVSTTEINPGVIRIMASHAVVNMPAHITRIDFETNVKDESVYPPWQVIEPNLVVTSVEKNGITRSANENVMNEFAISRDLAKALSENDILSIRRSFKSAIPNDTIAYNKYRKEYVKVPDVSIFYDVLFSKEKDPVEMAIVFSSVDDLIQAYAIPIPEIQQCAETWIPNDTLIPKQWYLDELDDHSVGGSSVKCAWSHLSTGLRGFNVLIGMIDAGIGRPGEIEANLDLEAKTDPGSSPFRLHHGTATTGVAAAFANNTWAVAGVAPDAKVIVVDPSDPNVGSIVAISSALEYYFTSVNPPPPIISISMGHFSGALLQDSTEQKFWAQKLVEEKNVVIVAGAGNLPDPNAPPTPSWPSMANDWVISVGGKAKMGSKIWPYTNYGCPTCDPPIYPFVDLIAPAESIMTLRAGNQNSEYLHGTSFSAPIVSGLVALAYGYNAYIPVDSIRAALEETAVPIYSGHDPLKAGNGSVDGNAFMDRIQSSFQCRIPGDVDLSCEKANIIDLNFMVNLIFRSGPFPPFWNNADMNGDCSVNILDLNILVGYLFRFESYPVKGCYNTDFN